MKKKIALLCSIVLCVLAILPAYGSEEALSAEQSSTSLEIINKEQEKEQTQAQLETVEAVKAALEQKKVELEGYLGELQKKLQELADNILALEAQIAGKQAEITALQGTLEVAKQDEGRQYQDMKKRIQYMYEQGNLSLYMTLMSGKSISDFISRTEYIAKISKFDRDLLAKYQDTRSAIAENESKLLKQQEELAGLQANLKSQQADLETTVASTQENIKKHQAEIAASELKIQSAEMELAQMEAQLNQLYSIQEAEAIAENSKDVTEAARRAQEIANSLTDRLGALGIETPDSVTPVYGEAYPASATDLVLLATLIYVEAGVEPFEGKCAVGACVMNRIRSAEFPNSIIGVIYDPGQFTPVRTGRFALALAQGVPDDCYRAAQMALNGYNNIGSYLYFRTPNGRVSGLQIGGHIFHDGHVF